jgi:hypothetical protein
MFLPIFNKIKSHFLLSRKFIIAFSSLIVALFLISICYYHFYDENTDTIEKSKHNDFETPLPTKMYFANEAVPLHSQKVKQIMYNTIQNLLSNKAHLDLLNQRANKWFPIILPILKKNNIPEDFKYVALIESYLSNVFSPKGAAGFWQFVKPTAIKYGLEINENVDERLNVEKATLAAALYFKDAYKTFNNWTLTAASYNLGITGVQNKIDNHIPSAFYSLKMNRETSVYLFKLIAVKELLSKPNIYHIDYKKPEKWDTYKMRKIIVDTTITNINSFAYSQKITSSILKHFNPWLISNVLQNEHKKKYVLEIPLLNEMQKNKLESSLTTKLENEDADTLVTN